ncbi:MAG: DUF4465 domain-containing protein [Muribaculaceae bacterium]|nr:DUF4465 domain-containing protein [Muribaculaceae bacterium]MBR6490565.1 DUF4465 domain-containing protein [Muribaculaceae bacterium]
MKKLFTLFAAVALTASAAMAGVITLDLNKPLNPTSLEYNENGIWTGCYDDVNYTWLEFGDENGEFALSHLIDGEGASWGGYYWDGFCPAIGGDQTDYNGNWTSTFGGCMAGGGCVINEDGSVSADPDQPYLVAYYSSWAMEGPSNQVMFMDKDGNTTFTPVGVYICNHPWPYYGCVHGDGFGRAFEEGDYFELVAHGVDADENEKTVSINLVEFTNGELIALNDWTFFDLSGLGEVESVYFTLNSTDSGAYGMNTAAYFCMDKFMIEDGAADEGYYVVGTFNDWNQDANGGRIQFVDNKATAEFEANAEFKVITPAENGGWIWYGGEDANGVGYFLLNNDLMGVNITLCDGANFRIAEAGTYNLELVWAKDDAPMLKVTPAEPSAISSVGVDTKADNAYYNLMGVKYNSMPSVPGIYIHNGKKVIIK